MASRLTIGCLVTVDSCGLGVGKLIDLRGDTASVEWFTSISNHLEGKDDVCTYGVGDLQRRLPYPQTRCYVTMADEKWRIGRFIDAVQSSSRPDETIYEVRFPGCSGIQDVPEKDVFVRCYKPSSDPIDRLVYSNQETPFFYSQKREFIRSVIEQRALSRGLSACLSSRIQLLPHQIRVVNRILQDPVQRYLLADEVGLGKTIEAGIILRQTILDKMNLVQDGTFRAILIVPKELKGQWSQELLDKFYIRSDTNMLQICDAEDFKDVELTDRYDICIVDEAHNITGSELSEELWQKYVDLSSASDRLLLLSATPVIRHEDEYLAMLSLLEPSQYDRRNVQAFRQGIEDRQPIAHFLLAFDPGLKPVLLKQHLKTLRRLFAGHETIMSLTDELERHCALQPPDQMEIDSIIGKIRLDICETCRIYRRMIKTPRGSVDRSVLVERDIDSKNLREEFQYDERIETITDLLEEWRTAANVAIAGEDSGADDARTIRLTNIFILLLECFDNSVDIFRVATEYRLALGEEAIPDATALEPYQIEVLSSEPHFPREWELLNSMIRAAKEEVDEDKYDFLRSNLEQAFLHRQDKCVIFTSATSVATELIDRLQQMKLGAEVVGCLYSSEQHELPKELDTYYQRLPLSKPTVLVCDRSGEEGLNLQRADLLIHFDLPWNPNRIEQRIGRFDRIGRTSVVQSLVFLPCELESDQNPGWLPGAWYEILKEGFNVFSESIADLQFYTNRIMPMIKDAAFRGGSGQLKSMVASLKHGIDEERRIVREQNFLDAIEAFEGDTDDFIGALIEYDSDGLSIQKSFDSWIEKTLHFDKEVKESYKYGENRFVIDPDNGMYPVRYKYQSNEYQMDQNGTIHRVSHGGRWKTLVPIDIWAKIRHKKSEFNVSPIETYGAFSRKQACQIPGMAVVRLGHPLYEFMYENALWDDRGQAYAMWRCIPELRFGDSRLFFVLDYVVAVDIDSLSSEISGLMKNTHSREALQRQADAWFPPRFKSICIDQDLQMVEDARLVEFLTRPYVKLQDGGSDMNLDEDLSEVIFAVVDEDHWSQMCREVRSKSEQSIREAPDLLTYCGTRYEHSVRELQTKLERLKLALRFSSGSRITSIDQSAIDSSVGEEYKLYSALVSRIRTPDVMLISAGAIILSRNQMPSLAQD